MTPPRQLFSDSKTAVRRAVAEQAAPPPSSSIVAGQPSNTVEVRSPAPPPDIAYSTKPAAAPSPRRPDTVDSFVPESGDFDSFLAEEGREGGRSQDRSVQEGESSEEEGGNPMVARLDDSVEVESYAVANGSHVTAAQEDSSEDEQGGNPVVARPKDSSEDEAAQEGAQKVENNLDDFLDS